MQFLDCRRLLRPVAVYFGAVGVKRIRHALVAGLSADVAGVIASAVAVWLMI